MNDPNIGKEIIINRKRTKGIKASIQDEKSKQTQRIIVCAPKKLDLKKLLRHPDSEILNKISVKEADKINSIGCKKSNLNVSNEQNMRISNFNINTSINLGISTNQENNEKETNSNHVLSPPNKRLKITHPNTPVICKKKNTKLNNKEINSVDKIFCDRENGSQLQLHNEKSNKNVNENIFLKPRNLTNNISKKEIKLKGVRKKMEQIIRNEEISPVSKPNENKENCNIHLRKSSSLFSTVSQEKLKHVSSIDCNAINKEDELLDNNVPRYQTGTLTRNMYNNVDNQPVSNPNSHRKVPESFPCQISTLSKILVKLTPQNECAKLNLFNGTKDDSHIVAGILNNEQHMPISQGSVHNFNPELMSTPIESVEGEIKNKSELLTDLGKRCLELIPLLFNSIFGISVEECFNSLLSNNYDVMKTIIELQNL